MIVVAVAWRAEDSLHVGQKQRIRQDGGGVWITGVVSTEVNIVVARLGVGKAREVTVSVVGVGRIEAMDGRVRERLGRQTVFKSTISGGSGCDRRTR